MKFVSRAGLMPLIGLLPLVIGCTDKDYDFSKDIDTTVSVEGNVSIPVGYSEFIPIDSFLGIDDGSVKTDDDDNYYLSLLSPTSVAASIDTYFEFSLNEPKNIRVNADISMYSDYFGQAIDDFIDGVNPVHGSPFPQGTALPVDIDSEVPSWLVDISEISLENNIRFVFSASKNTVITLKKGMEINFPEFFVLEASASDKGYTVLGGHVIHFDTDTDVSGRLAITLKIDKIDFKKVPEGMGVVDVDGVRKIVVGGKDAGGEDLTAVTVTGEFELDLNKFTIMPSEAYLDMTYVTEDFSMTSATVKLDLTQEVDPKEVEVGDLPDLLSGEGTVIDLYNPVITFTIDNTTPITLGMNLDLNAFKGGSSSLSSPIHIGEGTSTGDGTEKINAGAGTADTFYISRRGYEGAAQGRDIIVPRLRELFNPIPEKVSIENIVVNSVDEGFVTIEAGTYDSEINFRIDAALAFDTGLMLTYETSIDGMNSIFDKAGDFTIDVEQLEIPFNVQNTVPVGFSLDAKPIDKKGNVLHGISIAVSGDIAPGRISAMSTSPCTATLSGPDADLKKFDGLLIEITGTSDETVAGIPLNAAQGIQLTDIKARIVGGISRTL